MSGHGSRVTGHGFFVTGTDTGVGKTLVACALIHALVDRGLRVAAMKPVAAGAAPVGAELVNEDVVQLMAAANVAADRRLVNPYCFAPAVAPHIAAHEAGVTIDVQPIAGAAVALAGDVDFVVAEGAGGFYVPISGPYTMADVAQALGWPVILVVGLRLGCLNHALLTAEAIRTRGLRLAGWVANQIDAGMARVSENVAALSSRISAPCLGRVGHSAVPDSREVARLFDQAVIDELLRTPADRA